MPWRALASFVLVTVLAATAGLAQQSASSAVDAALRAGAFARAASLLEQQARAGDPEAQYKLGSLYRLGRALALDLSITSTSRRWATW